MDCEKKVLGERKTLNDEMHKYFLNIDNKLIQNIINE